MLSAVGADGAVLTRAEADRSAFARAKLRPDPTDPVAAVSSIEYQSAFADYRPFQKQPVAPWKQVLDEVAGVPGAPADNEVECTEFDLTFNTVKPTGTRFYLN